MASGMSVHVGINKVDPKHYDGWDGALVACEFDANDMTALAKSQGFEPRTILSDEADSATVLGAIADAAGALSAGDIFFLTYSGHGGRLPDVSGDEDDRRDETWVLTDRQVLDDELYALWSKFKPGVRILMASDSCHSGSVAKVIELIPSATLGAAIDLDLGPDDTPAPEHAFRGMPARLIEPVFKANEDLYRAVVEATPRVEENDLEVGVLLLSGCMDAQTSADGRRNGLFTETMLKVWADGSFQGGYRRFWRTISEKMPPWQTPQFSPVGKVSLDFRRQRPFSIS